MGLLLFTATFPAIAQTPNLTVCAGKGFKLISAKNAIGTSEVTYRWFQNEELMDVSIYNAASITIPAGKAAGVYAYVREASNSDCTLPSNTYTVEVLAAPAITHASGSTAQTVTAGSVIEEIKYNTANATGATPSNLPTGVSGAWSANVYTISGTPSATGTFGYTVTTANSNGCANTTASGTITVNAVATTPPNAYSANTWVYGSQTWSDRIVGAPSGCTQSDDLGSSSSAALYKVYDGRYYYTWPCVYNNQSSLCPSPWRVPSQSDFNTLVNNTNYSTLISAWGYGGGALGSSMIDVSSGACYWSSTEHSSSHAYGLGYDSYFRVFSVYPYLKYRGYQVRCVKD